MEQPDEHSRSKELLAVSLVAIIGLTGLVMMFKETGVTGEAFRERAIAGPDSIVGCNANEVLLNSRGIDSLKSAGRAKYGPDWSPYDAAQVNYNGVGYCANARVVRELLG